MASIPLISSSPCLFSRSLRTVPWVASTISITVTLKFHSFFNSPARSRHSSMFSGRNYFYYCCYSFEIFFTPALADGFHWSFRDSKSTQVLGTLLSILADINNVVVWMVSTCPFIFKPSIPFTNALWIVPSAEIKSGVTVIIISHSFFFRSLSKSSHSSSFSHFCNFTLWSAGMAKSTIWQVLFFGCWLLILNKSRRQHPTKNQQYGHLPTITKTLQVRRTIHAGHCWRSRDEIISDVLLWTPTYGRAKAWQPARIYIQQLCEDTGCSPEDLTEAMNDREKWRERVRDIRASGTTWWWWRWLLGLVDCTRLVDLFLFQSLRELPPG